MHKALLLLAIVGCNDNGIAPPPGDAGADGPLGDYFCTTTACATNPCSDGCAFAAKVGSCDSSLPATVATATVQQCRRFCGLFTLAGGMGCGLYHGEWPGCAVCGPRWGSFSCVEFSNSTIDYFSGGVICNQ